MALWNRKQQGVVGDLIGDDNSDEPRLTTTEAAGLYGPNNNRAADGFGSWQPLIRDKTGRWGRS